MREEARAWYEGALVDLEEARSAFREGRYNWAVFAAHQAVEKALKAAITILWKEPTPKTYDLSRPLSTLRLELLEDLRVGVLELSPYYTVAKCRPREAVGEYRSGSRGQAAKDREGGGGVRREGSGIQVELLFRRSSRRSLGTLWRR